VEEQGACGLDFAGGPGACEPNGNGDRARTMERLNPRIEAFRARRSKRGKART
jgi:hypothetical protein